MGFRGPGAKAVKAEVDWCYIWENPALSTAQKVSMFVETLAITSGKFAGTKFKLRPFQHAFIRGAYREVNSFRVVRTALDTMGRKNGKTELAAALAAAHLYGPVAESRGEVYSAASDRSQAGRIFRELCAFIEADPETEKRVNIQRFMKKIEVLWGPGKGSTYEALSSDARKAHSLSPSFVICDELAQWRDRELYDNLITGTGARENPLVVVISTMCKDKDHVMSELVREGEQINAGMFEDESFFASIHTVPMEADIWDENNWYLANPALGDFRSLEEMREFAKKAKRSEANEAVFRNLYLNQPVAANVKRWIPVADWQACGRDVDLDALRGRPCVGAIDLSSTGKNDLTALVLLFDFEDHWIVLPYFWASAEGLEAAEKRDHAPYRKWVKEGFLSTVPGRVMDYGVIARKLAEIQSEYELQVIALDPYKKDSLLDACDDINLDIDIREHGQTFPKMDPSVTALEDAILSWKLIHPKNPILNWNNENVLIELDSIGNRKLSKRKSRGRIDGMTALAMAAGLAKSNDADSQYVEGSLVIL